VTYALKFLSVVAFVMLLDVAYALYFLAVAERQPIRAGLWASVVTGLAAATAISYVADNTMTLAALVGSFLGTTGTVYWKKRTQPFKVRS